MPSDTTYNNSINVTDGSGTYLVAPTQGVIVGYSGTLTNSSTGIFSINGNSNSVIRSNSRGELIYGDVVDYINEVNRNSVRSTSTMGTTTPGGFGSETSTGIYTNGISYIGDYSLTWSTDQGVLRTCILSDGSIFIGGNYQRDIKRRKIRSGLTIIPKSRADYIPKDIPDNERVALETLHEEVSEKEFRRYVKHGFLLIRGDSGDTYQIFRNKSHTKVWRAGKVIEEVCVRISDHSIPPTDSVIAFKNIIQYSEEEFKGMGNVYKKGNGANEGAAIFTGTIVGTIVGAA